MARNYDYGTMTCIYPITLEKANEPYCCNHCMNAFVKISFFGLELCPICRKKIINT